MKTLLIIMLILCSTLVKSATYYISPSGIDASNRNGSVGQEWKSLYYASTRVTAVGSIIYINKGQYIETNRISINIGINLIGEGNTETGSVIICRYIGGDGNHDSQIALETANGWLGIFGNQSISNIRFDGEMTCNAAIYIMFRSNITIQNCSIINFRNDGIKFLGQPNWVRGGDLIKPVYWCIGNKLLNNIIDNCSSSTGENASAGLVRIGGQLDMEIAGNRLTQTTRPTGENGYGIKQLDAGWNRRLKIHNNYINVAPPVNSPKRYAFAIEIWYFFDETEIYENEIIGCIDVCYTNSSPGYAYSIDIHDNEIYRPSFIGVEDYGILLECVSKDIRIHRNRIHGFAGGIMAHQFTGCQEGGGNTSFSNIDIYLNLIYDIGVLPNANTSVNGIQFHAYNPPMAACQNISVRHNIIAGGNTSTSCGIRLPDGSNSTGFNVINNILTGWDDYAIYGERSYTLTNFKLTNNLYYQNGVNGLVTSGGYNFINKTETNNITANPLFISQTDFHLTANSPAIGKGINTDIPSDFDFKAFLSPPAIGGYEYTIQQPNIKAGLLEIGNFIIVDDNIITE